MSIDTLSCLKASGFTYCIHECWIEENGGTFWHECVDNIANAWLAGYTNGIALIYSVLLLRSLC